jgi:methionyl-tRNA formyltransferase
MSSALDEKLNFVFFGTPDVARETLEILKRAGFLPALIVTSPDKPQGRKMLITPPPAKVWAQENKIPYLQPEKLDAEFADTLKDQNYELFLVVAYGKIIPENILNLPALGSINVHYSLLPKYRGASPVQSAILNGDKETGVTIQKMVYKMDAGPVLAEAKVGILPDEKAPELRGRLIQVGGELLVESLPEIMRGSLSPTPQDESKATHSSKIKKEDGLIDLNGDPEANYNKFRAYAHWPRTFFFKDGKRIIITDAQLEDRQFVIKKVLPEGRKEISWNDFNKN